MEVNREVIEEMIRTVLAEKSGAGSDSLNRQAAGGVLKINVPQITVSSADKMDTGKAGDQVYTHDLLKLSESPRLGCGIMEMEKTTFDWTLNYDEIDYVMEGMLTIVTEKGQVTAGPGEIIFIPKGSAIKFSVPGKARFLYVTYPADWAGQ